MKRKTITLAEAFKAIPPGPFLVDPLEIGTPYNVETADARQSLCITNENAVGGLLRRNYQRHVAAEVIAHTMTHFPALVNELRRLVNATTEPTPPVNRRAIAARAAALLAQIEHIEVTEELSK